MTEIYTVPEAFKNAAKISSAKYNELYSKSISNPDAFWAEQAERLVWDKKWSKVKNTTFKDNVSIKWFEGLWCH